MVTPGSAPSSDIAFTPAVKRIQERKGSRRAYANQEAHGGWKTAITPDLQEFIEAQITVYLATVNADGQPYIQHRGGPPGFLHVLDEHTIAFADFKGNRQYITSGNLTENPKAHLFLMDYMHQQRVKVWGEAKVVENDAELMARLMPADYSAKGEQVIVFTVKAWDANCPQHIPLLAPVDEVREVIRQRDEQIQELKAEVAKLRARVPKDKK
jgi:uncharacterized protein